MCARGCCANRVYGDAGSGHKHILRKARDFPKDYAIVYFFGSHDLYVLFIPLP